MDVSHALWFFHKFSVGARGTCGCDHVCLKTTHLLNWDEERNGFKLMFAPAKDKTHTHTHLTNNQNPH